MVFKGKDSYFLSYYFNNTTISQIHLYKKKVTSCWYSNNCLKHLRIQGAKKVGFTACHSGKL